MEVETADTAPPFATIGKVKSTFEVGLSYRIVELFSEGLYQSANKAFEELVTNSFDAGAENVQIILPPDAQRPDATIVVIDDGDGMNAVGLEELWQIGASAKPMVKVGPRGRLPIGKFGIGKLATYTLATRLTYVCKQDGSFVSTSMNFGDLDAAATNGLTTERVMLDVRELTEAEAVEALQPWTSLAKFTQWDHPLFGDSASPNWTFAILSDLKDKAGEIQPGRLKWILSTALPLRDDFAVILDGREVKSSKLGKKRLKRWVIGKDIKEIKKPGPTDLEVRLDEELDEKDQRYYGLHNPRLGRITGFAELYADPLTGKSDDLGRSYGFFVHVRSRLINIEDEYFGVDSNLLKHGVFSRSRIVVHIDSLNEHLQSNREGVRDGSLLVDSQNFLHALFNVVRGSFERHAEKESEGARVARRLEGRRGLIQDPIVALVRKVLLEGATSRYLSVPTELPEEDRDDFLEAFEARASKPEAFLSDVEYTHALSPTQSLAVYDVAAGVLQLNGLHPFVAAFADDFQSLQHNLPLHLFALAEIALEATLHERGLDEREIDAILIGRDETLREMATSAPRNAVMVAQALEDAKKDKNQLEIELVAAFASLGFEARRIGGNGKPDGIAWARRGAETEGEPRAYRVSLEAKSKATSGKKVSAKSVGISTVARHRNDHGCAHAIVVGPDFPTAAGESSALAKEITAERDKVFDTAPVSRTLTLVKVHDLATLVRHAAPKGIVPAEIQDLFETCSLPEEASEWIRERVEREAENVPYAEILETIWAEQDEDPLAPVTYDVVRVKLRERASPIEMPTSRVRDHCRALQAMKPEVIVARDNWVELQVPPDKALAALRSVLGPGSGVR